MVKNLWYFIVKNAPRVLQVHAIAEKSKHENFDFVLLLYSTFCFIFHLRKSTSIRHAVYIYMYTNFHILNG